MSDNLFAGYTAYTVPADLQGITLADVAAGDVGSVGIGFSWSAWSYSWSFYTISI